jgi:hypothetical protein
MNLKAGVSCNPGECLKRRFSLLLEPANSGLGCLQDFGQPAVNQIQKPGFTPYLA